MPTLLAGLLIPAIALAGCGAGSKRQNVTNTGATAAPRAKLTQTNPPGDIPDTQRFLTYSSPSGYRVLYPEGWSRTMRGSGVRFTWHYDGEQVSMLTGNASAHIRSTFTSVKAMRVTHARIHGNPVTLYTFTSQSRTNSVTGRSVRLESNSYVYANGTRLAVVDLWAPQGADNVDQWRKISQSFRWK